MRIFAVLRLWATLAAAFVVTNATVPNKLDLPLLRQVTPNRGTNQAVSPFLVTNVLSQLWLGAKGNTQSEIGTTLGISSEQQLKAAYIPANTVLSQPSSVTTALFNRIYIRKNFSVKRRFLSIIKAIYGADVKRFSSIPAAVQAINTDVARVTRDRIKDLVNADTLRNAELVLVGALYFKGEWQYKFKTVGQRRFLTSSGNRQVPMMQLETRLSYRKFRDFDVVSLPYSNKDYSLLIFRPLQRSQAAVNKLYNSVSGLNIDSIYSQIYSRSQVVVTMPKFKIESQYELKSALSTLGMSRMFTQAADFSGISHIPLKVSKVVHKVFMEVNEKGTEAAAAVAVVLTKSASVHVKPPVDFTVDRPFLAVLYHNKQKLNLFSAWVANP